MSQTKALPVYLKQLRASSINITIVHLNEQVEVRLRSPKIFFGAPTSTNTAFLASLVSSEVVLKKVMYPQSSFGTLRHTCEIRYLRITKLTPYYLGMTYLIVTVFVPVLTCMYTFVSTASHDLDRR